MDNAKYLSTVAVTSAAEIKIGAEVHLPAGAIARAPRQQSIRLVLVGARTAVLYLTLYLLTAGLGWSYFYSAAVGFMIGSTTFLFD